MELPVNEFDDSHVSRVTATRLGQLHNACISTLTIPIAEKEENIENNIT